LREERPEPTRSSFSYPPFAIAIKKTPNVKAVIDLNKPFSGANWTTDGIHLGKEGYALWMKALVDGVSDALGCTKQ
jgi:lysophospholipase L1-like esterase